MKTTLGLLALLFASACSGPEVPSAFQPDSPASPAASPAPRPPVAAVLAASDPRDASVCVPEKPCVLPDSEDEGGSGHQHGGHDHGNHGGHDHGNHGGHDHGNHGGKTPAPPPTGHEGHRGHHH
ncbi:hypothetical protein [Polyangium sp. 15x6]|uniref:hypothetical protein n=1 Tax=Polyangium sp. 15x6 TaxID=3042687 RepID=UPI00249A5B3E|nr:hypothetical protein [Polyangium sp. 15x6]MDI3284332.1 hypothetical protein [Polyangium sp. 15x6]